MVNGYRLDKVHPDLVKVIEMVDKGWEVLVLEGHRGQESQDKAYNEGKSKLKYPNSKHNSLPSKAVDVIPKTAVKVDKKGNQSIAWDDWKQFYGFSCYVLGVADTLGVSLVWGGDWDGDKDFSDNKFQDLVHFELE